MRDAVVRPCHIEEAAHQPSAIFASDLYAFSNNKEVILESAASTGIALELGKVPVSLCPGAYPCLEDLRRGSIQ